MKTILPSLAVILTAAFWLESCGEPVKTVEKTTKSIQGELKDRRYTNDYFGFTAEAPANWYVMKFKRPKKEKPYQLDLFQAMIYSPDSGYIDNGNIYISGELKNHNPLMNTGADYLSELRDGLEMIAVEGDEFGEIKAVTVDGKKWHMLETYSNDPDRELETRQQYYATLMQDYWILITLTYYDDEQKASLEKCLAGIQLR